MSKVEGPADESMVAADKVRAAVLPGDNFGVISQRGKQKVFIERVLAPRSRLFSRLLVFVCSSWCDGLVDWALMMHRRRHFGQGNIPIVAPLHACRKGFAAFGCAVMVSLPQTAPGVTASRIDPTAEELQQIGDVAGILSWVGSWEPVRSALIRLFGGGQPLLRDVAVVHADLWQAIRGLRIPQGEIQRDLSAPEVEHVAIMRRIARLRLGLTAHDEAKVLEVHASYVELRGAKSSEDIEPSLSSSSVLEEHKSRNPVLGLCCHCYVGPIIEHICSGSLLR